jgi:hypothetical protein
MGTSYVLTDDHGFNDIEYITPVSEIDTADIQCFAGANKVKYSCLWHRNYETYLYILGLHLENTNG